MFESGSDRNGAALLRSWRARLRAPLIAAPMFIASGVELVIAQCTSGVIGTFPALNARSAGQLDGWLCQIGEALAAHDRRHPDRPSAPLGVNLVCHRSNARLDEDLALCVRHRVPLVISSMGAREDINQAIQSYGGVTLHDVTTQTHARKAVAKGATGLIAVAAGAGGHAGRTSPFALVAEIRQWFDGPLVLAGAISTGREAVAARLLGADFAYVGSPFIATEEAAVTLAQKQGMIGAGADDIVYTAAFSGTPANYLRASIVAQGLDPDALPQVRRDIEADNQVRAARTWTDIWGCGQGVGSVHKVLPAAVLIDRMVAEYRAALGYAGALVEAPAATW